MGKARYAAALSVALLAGCAGNPVVSTEAPIEIEIGKPVTLSADQVEKLVTLFVEQEMVMDFQKEVIRLLVDELEAAKKSLCL